MDAAFASTMEAAVDALSNGFKSFTGSTITEAIWNGEAADNAKNQVTEKIDTKVEAVKAKLQNLISAIQEAENAQTAKSNIETAESEISKLDTTATNYEEVKSGLEQQIEEFKKVYDESIEKVKSLCSE